MKLSDLRERVTFYHDVTTADGAGGATTTREKILSTYAAVEPLTASRALETAQSQVKQAYSVVIRRRDGFYPDTKMFVEYRGRMLYINQAIDIKEEHWYQQITAVTTDTPTL